MDDCDNYCHTIYDRDDTHAKRRDRGRRILGKKAQFCDAFYHVPQSGSGKHSCLDENNCTIAKRAKEPGHSWKVQPKTVVVVAKFEVDEKIKYEARYTNCHSGKEHAEDHFDLDIRIGKLSEELNNNAAEGNKLITLYLTYQPCNKSTGETTGTKPNQSCCKILRKVYSEVLRPKNIRLSIKATHTRRLDRTPAGNKEDEKLRRNAVRGIQQLIKSGVNVSGMEKKDWDYLFTLTCDKITGDEQRATLDETINEIFAGIPTWKIE